MQLLVFACQVLPAIYSAVMAKTSEIVGRSCAPACRVINETPMPPIQAMTNKYPGGGGKGVNTEPGAKGYQVESTGATYPDHVLPKGSTL
jgi:hypothetical protein